MWQKIDKISIFKSKKNVHTNLHTITIEATCKIKTKLKINNECLGNLLSNVKHEIY